MLNFYCQYTLAIMLFATVTAYDVIVLNICKIYIIHTKLCIYDDIDACDYELQHCDSYHNCDNYNQESSTIAQPY